MANTWAHIDPAAESLQLPGNCGFINLADVMDLRDIEYFAVIAAHGHLGRAAEALGLGQPALSLSLRRLENSAGAKLVKRTPKGVELTDVGSALLSHVQRLRLARENLAREISDLAHGRAGHLRVGATPVIANGPLVTACTTLLKDAPRASVNVSITATTATMLEALRKGELDLVVSQTRDVPRQGLVLEWLWADEFVVYASVRHRLAKRKSVALADLVHERWASSAAAGFLAWNSLRHVFEERGLPTPEFAVVSDSGLLNSRMVASLGLLGTAPRRALDPIAKSLGLKPLRLADAKWIRKVAVIYRQDGYLSPVAKRFVEILKSLAMEITNGSRS
jgi:DNA-binding transcriptional LysR family regulator